MRTLITTHFVSLDGVAEGPGGEPGFKHSGWTFDVESDPASYEQKGLGSGRSLFPTDAEDKVKLRLVDSTRFTNGVQYQSFRPAT